MSSTTVKVKVAIFFIWVVYCFRIVTERIILNKTTFDKSFVANSNSSITMNISDTASDNVALTTMMGGLLLNYE